MNSRWKYTKSRYMSYANAKLDFGDPKLHIGATEKANNLGDTYGL